MNSVPLSQWADSHGIPRRTAYNWAKNGKLNVPLHRTLTGRLMVLDDDDDDDDSGAAERAHPFAAAYAEALELPVGDRTADMDHSPVLEAWAMSLYDAVAPDLRPAVLQLAVAAASRRPKRDAPVRFADWIGRVELADWYESTGLPEAAAMVRSRSPITDEDSFRTGWPTGVDSFEWRNELDELVGRCLSQAGGDADSSDHSAVEYLAENGIIGVNSVPIAGRRESLRAAIGAFETGQPPGFPLPDKGELWDLQALYADPMYALARPASRATARVICEVIVWDPQSPAPPQGHPLHEAGFTACTHAARVALAPFEHAAHLREISALRRIALGQPLAGQRASGLS
jgi:hypothetical protein